MWMPNVEFCHIIVDTGIFDHHMPDSVQGAIERLYQHQIIDKQTTDMKPDDKNDIPVQYHCHSTEEVCISEPTHAHQLDETNNIDKGTIKATDVNERTIEVTIHNLSEGENKPSIDQKESTSL